jgi:O-antigen ligase
MKNYPNSLNVSSSENIKLKRDTFKYILFFIIIFSNIVFRTEEYINLYAFLSIVVVFFVTIRMMFFPNTLSKTIINRFSLWVFLLFSVYFYYGIVRTTYYYFSIQYFLFMFIMLLVTTLLLIETNRNKLMDILIKVSASSSLIIFVYTFVNEWQLILQGGTRIGESGSGNVNTLAIYIGVLSVPSLYKIMYDKKLIYIVPYLASLSIILLSGSKKGLLYILLAVGIFSVFKNRARIHKYVPIIIALGVIIYLVLNNNYLFNIIGFRIIDFLGTLGLEIKGANVSHSTELRLLMNKLGLQAFMEHPIFGGGWFYFSQYSGLGTYSHNNYIEILVTYGLVGFFLYYSMYAFVLLKLYKIKKSYNFAKLLYTMIILNLINDFFSVSFSYNLVNYIILLISFLFIESVYFSINKKGINDEKNSFVNRLQ